MHVTHHVASEGTWRIAVGRRVLRLVLGTLVVATTLVTGCSNAPSKGACEELRDKLVDLEFVAMGAKAQTSEAREQIAKQKKETSDGVTARFIDSCTKKTPKTLIDCALKATSLEAVKLCDERKP